MKRVPKEGILKKGLVLVLTCASIAVSGCGRASTFTSESTADYNAGGYDADYGVYEEKAAMTDSAPVEGGNGSGSVGEIKNNSSRKLITTVNLSAETEDIIKSVENVEKKVSELGGYIESSNTNNKGYRSANLTIRVPADKLDLFVESIEEGTNILNKSVNVQDVTLSYVDIQSRKNALKTEEKRLLEILESAQTVEELIIVEDKLANVRYELESIESQLRSYDNQVDYSTVFLNMEEVKIYTPAEKEGIFTRMGKGFMENLRAVIEGLGDFLVDLVAHIPQIVVLAVVVGIIVMIIKAIFSVARKKKLKKMEMMKAAYMKNQGMNSQGAGNQTVNSQVVNSQGVNNQGSNNQVTNSQSVNSVGVDNKT